MNDKALYNKERKERLKEQGMCVECAKQPAELNKTLCAECAEKQRIRTAERKEWLIEHNICITCGQQDAEPHKRLCFECAEKNRIRSAQYRANMSNEKKKSKKEQMNIKRKERWKHLKAQGICPRCGHRKAIPNKTMCVECNIKNRRASAKWRNTEIPRDLRKDLGYCYICEKPLNEHHYFCDECLQRARNTMKKINEKPTEAMVIARKEYAKYNRLFFQKVREKNV